FEFGEERGSRRIARAIIQRRDRGEPVATTKDLANLVERAVGRGNKRRIHPATRTFQALRIAVNGELENLDRFLFEAVDHLEPDGRLAVISFHSLEDRIVKRTLQKLSGRCQCPPRLPKCICGAKKAIEILTKRALARDKSAGEREKGDETTAGARGERRGGRERDQVAREECEIAAKEALERE